MPDPIIFGMKPVSCVWMQCLLMLVLVIDTSRDTQLQYTRGTLTTVQYSTVQYSTPGVH